MSRGDLQTILDHITSERRNVENYVNSEIKQVKSEIKQVNTKVDALQNGVSTLKKDVSGLKEDVSGLKEDVSDLKTDVSDLKTKVDTLTDAVIEGFDNTEQILSDWEGKPVNLIPKQTKAKLQKPKEGQANHES
jgi:chromosome segregation ATPase